MGLHDRLKSQTPAPGGTMQSRWGSAYSPATTTSRRSSGPGCEGSREDKGYEATSAALLTARTLGEVAIPTP